MIGKRIRLEGAARGQGPSSREIVGVVGDVRRFGLHEAARPGIYLTHAQAWTGANAFFVRGERPAAALLDQTRRAIWQINPTLPVYRETTMADLVGASIQERRFVQVLLTAFAALALALAAAGIFGLMSFVTTRRTRNSAYVSHWVRPGPRCSGACSRTRLP